MLDQSEEDLKKMGIADIHLLEDSEYLISDFEALARGEKILLTSVPFLRKDGTIIYTDIRLYQSAAHVDTSRLL